MKNVSKYIRYKGDILIVALLSIFILGCEFTENESAPSQATCDSTCSEILWDDWGVPHIYAPSQKTAFYSFGRVQIQNHSSLLLKLYAQARGQGAEHFGEDYLESDILTRELRIPETASSWLELQDGQYLDNLAAFAKGINDYAQENPEAIDKDLSSILPITTQDILSHTLRIIHYKFVTGDAISDAYAMMGYGSNGMAISPSRTESGSSMLLINPHLPWSDYFRWMEAHIVMPGMDAYGVALIGTPYLGIATTPHLSWTHTVNPVDGADHYRLTVKDDSYLVDGQWLKFEEDEVHIKVKQPNGELIAHTIDRRKSIHGPLVSKYGENIALRVVGLDAPNLVKQYWDMAMATDLDSFQTAISRMQLPFFNTIYADNNGDIFYIYGGREPDRGFGSWADWLGVQPGEDSKYIWNETLNSESLPRITNPTSGFIQNANDAPWSNTYPFSIDKSQYSPRIAPYNGPDLRAQRSLAMLVNDDSISFDELSVIRADTQVESALRFLPDLLKLAIDSNDEALKPAITALSEWNRRTDIDSRGAVLFLEWYSSIKRDHSYKWVSEQWNEEEPLATPRGIGNKDLALSYLRKAIQLIELRHGSVDIPYGQVYRIRQNGHDLPASVGLDEHGIFRVGYFREEDDGTSSLVGGQTYVSIVEYSEPMKMKAILPYGNSTEATTPSVKDQLVMFSEGNMRDVYLKRVDVERNLAKREYIDTAE